MKTNSLIKNNIKRYIKISNIKNKIKKLLENNKY